VIIRNVFEKAKVEDTETIEITEAEVKSNLEKLNLKYEEENGKILVPGVLEINYKRGVIYFHSTENGLTVLRICQLPVLKEVPSKLDQLDVTHMHSATWHHV
jgi:hypothetical protein